MSKERQTNIEIIKSNGLKDSATACNGCSEVRFLAQAQK